MRGFSVQCANYGTPSKEIIRIYGMTGTSPFYVATLFVERVVSLCESVALRGCLKAKG